MTKIIDLPKANVTPRVTLAGKMATHKQLGMQDECHDLQEGDRLYLVNERTGDTLESWTYDGRRHPKDKDWIRLYQRIAWDLCREPKLTLPGVRVWMAVLAKTSFGNAVDINITAFAKHFGYARKTVSSAVRSLVDLRIIERVGKTRGSFRLNPNYAWRGSGGARHHRLSSWASQEIATAEQKVEQTAKKGVNPE